MKRYDELMEMMSGMQKDFEKFYEKENKTAGIRLRKGMQDLRKLAKDIRDEVQIMKREMK